MPAQLPWPTEHYNRIARLLEHNVPVTLDIDVRSTFQDTDLSMFNIVAEIAGTDKADEIVMLGAHFDSWHAGTGATDNAAGSAVMLEAMRILKAVGRQAAPHHPRGAVGAARSRASIGSREYVKEHFGDPKTPQGVTPALRQAVRATSTRTTGPGSIAASTCRATSARGADA